MFSLRALFAFVCALSIPSAFSKDLTVYIRDSFYDKWEAPLRKAYAPRGQVRFVRLSGTALTTRLRLEGRGTKADVVMGAESAFMPQFHEMGVVGALEPPPFFEVPFGVDRDCVPFCYGYLGLLYNAEIVGDAPLPRSWQDLKHLPPMGLLCANPQTSSTGLMFWALIKDMGLEGHMQRRFLALPKGLAQTYGLFAAGKAPYVVGFTTSSEHRAGPFSTKPVHPLVFDAHPALAYVAFLTPQSTQNPDAQFFLSALVGAGVQKGVWARDHLYPVLKDLQKHVPVPEPKAISMAFTQKAQQDILAHFFAHHS